MKFKMDSLIRNATWDMVQMPKGNKVLPCKWAYKRKVINGVVLPKYKPHLVAKGLKEEQCIVFDEFSSPVGEDDDTRYCAWFVCK